MAAFACGERGDSSRRFYAVVVKDVSGRGGSRVDLRGDSALLRRCRSESGAGLTPRTTLPRLPRGSGIPWRQRNGELFQSRATTPVFIRRGQRGAHYRCSSRKVARLVVLGRRQKRASCVLPAF